MVDHRHSYHSEIAEEAYRIFLSNAPDGMFVTDLSGRFLQVNQAACRIFGFGQDEFLAMTLEDLVHPSNSSICREKMAEVLELGQSSGELYVTRKDQNLIPIAADLIRMSGDRVMILAKDITNQKLVEQALSHSESQNRRLFDKTAVSIWVEDLSKVKTAIDEVKAQGVSDFREYLEQNPEFVDKVVDLVEIQDVNEATLKLYGVGSKEELVSSLRDTIVPESMDIIREEIIAAAEGRPWYVGETMTRNMRGDRLNVLVTIPFPEDDESWSNVPISMVNITERKQVERKLTLSEQRFKDFADVASDWLWETDSRHHFVYESTSEPVRAEPGSEGHRHSVMSALRVSHDGKILSFREFLDLQQPFRDTECQHTENGETSYFRVSGRPVFARNGKFAGFRGAATDITSQRRAESELRMLSAAMEQSHTSVFITNADHEIEYVNPRFTEMTGYLPAEVKGKNPSIMKANDANPDIYRTIEKTLNRGLPWQGKLAAQKKDGREFWVAETRSPIFDEQRTITHYMTSQTDVTREFELSRLLSYQAAHDSLTDLVNRREFERRLQKMLNRLREEPGMHALCFIDLDQFKIVNDTCGHVAGDELLRQISVNLSKKVRSSDTLARLGGDEFGILMEHCDLEQATRVAKGLLESIQQWRFYWDSRKFTVGASIGLVTVSDAETSIADIMKNADTACYLAKDTGRNRIYHYRADDEHLVRREGEMHWVNRVNKALENDHFCLYVQPIVPLNGGAAGPRGYEMLIRMLGEGERVIAPGKFRQAAERYNLMTWIDRWVVDRTFTYLQQYPDIRDGLDFVSINLSGQSIADSIFLDYVESAFQRYQVDGARVCFEITETAAVSNMDMASHFIRVLKNHGCRFALDDFGSGLSSFGYLKHLAVDYIKIDGMFVQNMHRDPINKAMVKSINEIGQVMGMQTIAEFVVNDEIKDCLRTMGTNFVQGFGVGEPVPVDQLFKS